MENTVHLWHYLVMLTVFALLGALAHIARAVINPLPDRLTDSKEMDLMISPGYDLSDYFFNLDFDENGYYELYSAKNLRFCVISGLVGGSICVIGVPDINQMVAGWIDATIAFTVDLFWYRIENIRWI